MIALLLGYILLVLLLYAFHKRIVFRPTSLPEAHEFTFEHDFSELDFWDDQFNIRINALYFPIKERAKGIVLYFHGNADNLQRWGQYTVDFTNHGYEVLAVEYPGYGKSEGIASEEAVYRSAALAFEWAEQRFAAEKIIIYGRSLGSGPAAWLASRHLVQQLILETPFPSIPTLFRMRASAALVPFEPAAEFPVATFLQSVTCPVTIFHGTSDWVVPYRVAATLEQYLKPGDRFITIPNGGHRNLRTFPQYREKLEDLLK